MAFLIGSLISSCPGVENGRLHYCSIEQDKIIALKASEGNFETKMLLSGESREELQWWIQNVKLAYRNLQHGPSNVVIFTEASAIGWGAKPEGGMRTQGIWSALEATMHINLLEMFAVKLSLMSLLADKTHCHVRIMSDNTTVACYINDMGGSKSVVCHRLAGEKYLVFGNIQEHLAFSSACSWGKKCKRRQALPTFKLATGMDSVAICVSCIFCMLWGTGN